MEEILPKIISTTQTGFVKGRYILENLITCWESLHWAKESGQNGAMLLIDFEKAYDRIEWGYITQMLQSLGFPPGFCKLVKTLLCDANASVEVNGMRSSNFTLTRSIKQGCPLAPALFVLVVDAMFYLLKDSSITPLVMGISLPNKKEIFNVQFADDTAILIKLEEENLVALLKNIDIFCLASGSKIAMHKSNLLGWDDNPPNWFSRFSLNWLGPTQIVKYLSIPFFVLPNLKEMWEWVRNKIEKKLSKWNRNYLSLARRFQVCQKILASYNIYFSSAWLFKNYQFSHIQKQIREFLWLDGKGTRKQHAVKWEWCTMHKLYGGMGLKDLKLQGIALASKWILKAMDGDEPWKILLRNNITSSVPKKARKWKNLPMLDLLLGQIEVSPTSSEVFKSLWKAWEQVKHLVHIKVNGTIQGQIANNRSIWWSLFHNGKPLATLQGCSALKWHNMGIKCFDQIIENGQMRSWEELKLTFSIPISQSKTYNILKLALASVFSLSHHPLPHSPLSALCWANGTPLPSLKAKCILTDAGV